MNIVSYQFANNYSNINLPFYLYTKRKKNMSSGGGRKLKELRVKLFFLFHIVLQIYKGIQ